MKIDPALLDQSHVWVLPYLFKDYWWRMQTENEESLSANQNCSNEEMDAIIAGTNVVLADSMNYNIPGSHPSIKEMWENSYDIVRLKYI